MGNVNFRYVSELEYKRIPEGVGTAAEIYKGRKIKRMTLATSAKRQQSCNNLHTHFGIICSLAHHIVARVQIKNLSQYYVKKWKPLFHPGKLVTGKVVR